MKRIFGTTALLIVALASAGCAPRNTAGTYSQGQIGRSATVTRGVIVGVRYIAVQGTSSKAGTVTGAVAGGVTGTMVSKNPAVAIAGAAGGALAGGVIGAVAEEQLRRAEGVELIVRETGGGTIAVAQTDEEHLSIGESVLILRADRVRIIRDRSAASAAAPISP